jgi:hypothetical protein
MNILSRAPGTRQALGWAGPTDETKRDFTSTTFLLEPGFIPSAMPLMGAGSRMLVADITAVHRASGFPANALKGHHSDIFLPELYRLIAKFSFG